MAKWWEELLTDEDGQYIEVQAGRLISQKDTWIFEPHLVEEWKEVWYPVKNMTGFVKADDNFAVNLQRTKGGLLVSANATKEFWDMEFILEADGNKLFSWKDHINPQKVFRKEVIIHNQARNYRFIINDRDGKEVFSYSSRKPRLPEPELQPDMNLVKEKTAETEYFKGYYAVKDWDKEGGMKHFLSALELDGGFTPALLWLGILNYKMGKYDKAEELFNKALERDEDDYTSRYYRGLIRLGKGLGGLAEQDLYLAARRAEYRHVAPYILAGVEISKGNFRKAQKLMETVLECNSNDAVAHSMMAAVFRHLNRRGEAVRHTRKALELDPLCAMAILENVLLDERNDLEFLGDDPELYIETAMEYASMNLNKDALEILKTYKRRNNVRQHPMLYYLQAYLSSENSQEVENYLDKAQELGPDYVFPFRIEFEQVLQFAIKKKTSDWKAHYYLGNLLTSKGRWKEGMNHYLLAADQDAQFSVLYRNMAVIYRDKLNDYHAAEKFFAKALSLRPEDYRLYPLLDAMMKVNKNREGREALHGAIPQSVQQKQSYRLSRAQYFYDKADYQEALKVLAETRFKPWEANSNEPYRLFQLANIKLALKLAAQGDVEAAQKAIAEIKTYPANLGTEKPNKLLQVKESFFTALVLHKCKLDALKAEELNRIKELKDVVDPEALLFKGLIHKMAGEKEQSKDVGLLILNSLEATPPPSHERKAERLYLMSMARFLNDQKELAVSLKKTLKDIYPLFGKTDFLELVILHANN